MKKRSITKKIYLKLKSFFINFFILSDKIKNFDYTYDNIKKFITNWLDKDL